MILLCYLGDVLVLRMGLYFIGSRIFNLASQRMLSRLRSRFFSHINYLCLRFHARKNSGELFSYLFGTPLASIVNFLNFVTTTVPYSLFTLIGTLVLVGSWNLSMTAVLAGCLVGNIILSVRAGRKIKNFQRDFQQFESTILLDPPVFIFDEATSALETVSERLIQETMEKIFECRTALIVAHRLSTIRFVDRILVFEHGRVVQDGTYCELARVSGDVRRTAQDAIWRTGCDSLLSGWIRDCRGRFVARSPAACDCSH